MLAIIVRKELRLALRSQRVWPLFGVWLVLAVLAALGALSAQHRALAARSAAAQADHQAWDSQGARNPHSAAHFGQTVYKPGSRLAVLEPGLDAWFGASIWMEAHYQNPAQQRAAEDLTPLSRMGTLSLGWMLQVLLPLTLLVLGYDTLAEERSRSVLKLQLVAGAAAAKLVAGKALSLCLTTLLVSAPAWIASLLIAGLAEGAAPPDASARLALWLLSYGGHALTWLLLTLAVSAVVAGARTSLAALASLWLVSVLLVPRLAGEQAEAAQPAPEPTRFWAQVRQAQAQGIDGHGNSDERSHALEQQALAQYGVARIEDLPVSFAGLALQAGEDNGNAVFDRYFGELWDGYAAQESTLRRYAVLAPVIAVRQLTMQAAATDVQHHRDFASAAEAHRRILQRYLNDDITRNARGQDFDYLATESLWKAAPRLDYRMPPMAMDRRSLLIVLAWPLAMLGACVLACRRLSREAA